jgi:hypothetical protein
MRIMDKLVVVRIEVGISVSKIREELIYQNKQCWLLNDAKNVQAYGCRLLPNLEFSYSHTAWKN